MKDPFESKTPFETAQEERTQKQMEDIVRYASTLGILPNSNEFFDAYQVAMDVPPNELAPKEKPLRKEVYELAHKMDEQMKAGLPANRIVTLAEQAVVKTPEELQNDFEDAVEELMATDKDKQLLRAVAKGEKEGYFSVKHKGTGKDIGGILVSKRGFNNDSEFLYDFTDWIDQFQGIDVVLDFEEAGVSE